MSGGGIDFDDDSMAEQANLNKNGYVDFDDYMAENKPILTEWLCRLR
jgi:hypothetical protein